MSSPSPDELKRRAQEIAVRLAARAQEVDRLRRPADESIRELEASGLLSYFVPREHGGLELDLGTYCHVAASLGEGCTSTAWVAVFYMIHGWIAAQFPAHTRRELFSDHPWFLAPGALAPTGRAAVAHGGYRVDGRWQWATGVAHAEWLMVTALVEREDAPEPRMFILPIAHAKIEDTWFTDGMRGTASHDVTVDDALVPEDRSLSLAELSTSGAPGAREHSNPLYRLPMVPLLALTAALTAVGTARAAVRIFQEQMRERRMHLTGTRQREKPAAQMRLARANVDVHAAWLLLRDLATRLEDHMEPESPLSLEERAELRMSAARAVDLCRGAVRSICEAAGASAHFTDNPLQRMHRDLETLACHTIFDGDSTAELAGRLMVGMDPGTPLL